VGGAEQSLLNNTLFSQPVRRFASRLGGKILVAVAEYGTWGVHIFQRWIRGVVRMSVWLFLLTSGRHGGRVATSAFSFIG